MTIRNITGNIKDLAGISIPNATFSLLPEVYAFGTTSSEVIFGDQVTVLSDTSGNVSFNLHEGKYIGRISTTQGAKTFRLIVDPTGPWFLGRLVDNSIGEITPTLIQQAFNASDDAEAAATRAETAAAGVEFPVSYGAPQSLTDVQTGQARGNISAIGGFASLADLRAAVAGGYVPEIGTVDYANNLPYRYIGGVSDPVGDLPGWDAVEVGGTFTASQFGLGSGGDDGPRADRLFARAGGREVVFEQAEYNFPAPDGYDVYLFAGGGNMAGENEGPIQASDGPDPRILIVPFTSTTTFGAVEQAVEPLKFPFRSASVAATSVGPALRFAKHMLETTPSNRGIIIVPVASSGTTLVSGSALWAVGNGRYNLAISASNAAMAHGSGVNKFRGILWQQGESDALASVSGIDYMEALAATVNGWRSAITGAERAILTIFGPVPEWEALGLGTTAAIYAEQRKCFKYIQRSSFRNGDAGNQTAPDATTFNRAGARLSGFNGGVRLQMFAAPDERSAFYNAPDGSRAKFTAGATFAPARMRNIIERWERQQQGGVAKRDIEVAFEQNDEYRFLDSFGQWDSAPVPSNRPRNHFVVSRYFEDADPIDSLTTTFFQAVSEPGSTNMLNSLATVTLALGENNAAWGAVFVVSNGENVRIPEGNPQTLIGLELDMQACEGTGVQSGAGLLVNCFVDPVGFAGVAIVGDAGGSWKTGTFYQNIQQDMILASGSLSCVNGINLAGGTYSEAAILLGEQDRVKFRGSGSATASELFSSSDNFLNLQLEAGFRVRGRSADGENETAITFERRSPSFQEFLRINSASGAAPNASASTLRVRANSTTSRAINAGGTINASGADYAEYEKIADGVGKITAGQIVGFDVDGCVTDKWADSVSFAVKSTNPSIVGGDVWWCGAGDEPVAPEYTCPVGECSLGDRPMVNNIVRDDEDAYQRVIEGQKKWDAEYAAWEAECEAARGDWENTTLADWTRDIWEPYQAKLEALRQTVDRIAYCGKTPVNVMGATVGQYVIPVQDGDGIGARLVDDEDLTFAEHRLSVGRVRRILDDGRAEIAVSM